MHGEEYEPRGPRNRGSILNCLLGSDEEGVDSASVPNYCFLIGKNVEQTFPFSLRHVMDHIFHRRLGWLTMVVGSARTLTGKWSHTSHWPRKMGAMLAYASFFRHIWSHAIHPVALVTAFSPNCKRALTFSMIVPIAHPIRCFRRSNFSILVWH